MSVSNGELADANNFNTSFVSRQDDTDMEGKLDLKEPASGGDVINVQQNINTNIAGIAQNVTDIAQNASDIVDTNLVIANLDANDIDETNARYWDIKNTHDAAINPTVNHDTSFFYTVGSMWYNSANNNVFIARDVTLGAAVWENITNPAIHYFGVQDAAGNWPNGTWRILDVAGLLTFEKLVSSTWTLFANFGE